MLRHVMAVCPFLKHGGMVQKDLRVCLQALGCSSLHVQLPRCEFQSGDVVPARRPQRNKFPLSPAGCQSAWDLTRAEGIQARSWGD